MTESTPNATPEQPPVKRTGLYTAVAAIVVAFFGGNFSPQVIPIVRDFCSGVITTAPSAELTSLRAEVAALENKLQAAIVEKDHLQAQLNTELARECVVQAVPAGAVNQALDPSNDQLSAALEVFDKYAHYCRDKL
jgi:hypothetical protein